MSSVDFQNGFLCGLATRGLSVSKIVQEDGSGEAASMFILDPLEYYWVPYPDAE